MNFSRSDKDTTRTAVHALENSFGKQRNQIQVHQLMSLPKTLIMSLCLFLLPGLCIFAVSFLNFSFNILSTFFDAMTRWYSDVDCSYP